MADLNCATRAQLMEVPGIDAASASKILNFRRENAVFVTKEELLKAGIPSSTYYHVRRYFVCRPVEAEKVTRQTYRRQNKDYIEDLEDERDCKMHVGHIVAETNGGAHHPDNYLLLPADINVKLRHRHDDVMFALAGKEQTANAVRESRVANGYNLTVQEAEERRQAAMKDWRTAYLAPGMDFPDGTADYPVELDVERARTHQDYCEFVIDIWNGLAGQ